MISLRILGVWHQILAPDSGSNERKVLHLVSK